MSNKGSSSSNNQTGKSGSNTNPASSNMGSSYQSGQRYSASQYNYGQTQSGSSSSNNQSGGSAPDDSFKETSKYEILKPYGGRPGFQASHGLKFDPGSEDWKEGDAIIEGLQNAADKEKRGGGR